MKIWQCFHKKREEEGSSALMAIAAIAALGLTSVYVFDQNQKVMHSVQSARSTENTNAVNIANMNSLARIKALLGTKKLPDGRYEPALLADNYYEAHWKLLDNVEVPAKEASLIGARKDIVVMKSVQVEEKSQEDVRQVLEGNSSLNQLTFKNMKVELVKTNFDANDRLALSVDVRVISQQVVHGQQKEIKSMARVPLVAPVPYNPILELSPVNTETWTRDFSNLQPGLYDARVLASGIAFDAEIVVNGGTPVFVGGFDPTTGKVISQANNYKARDAEVGRVEISLGAGAGSQVDCVFIPLDQNFSIGLKLFGPAGGAAVPENTKTYAVQTRGQVQGALSDKEYMAACNEQCPFVGPNTQDKWENKFVEDRFEAGKFGDMTHAHYMQENRYSWNVADKKLCMNFVKLNELYKATHDQKDAKTWGDIADNGRLEQMDIYTYDAGTCKRNFLFIRGTCGCFSDDTKILMGDGKTEKRITDLTEADKVWNPRLKTAMSILRMTRGPEKIPMLAITVAGKSVKVTGKHPFPTPEGVRTAYSLKAGDLIQVGEASHWAKVDSIEALPSSLENPPVVWNLELQGGPDEAEHYVVADGVVTGDLYLQSQLEKQSGIASSKP